MTKRISTLALLPLLLAGCSMAPEYQAPATGIADRYAQASTGTAAAPLADLGWRDFFLDEGLRGLIDQALVQNHDLLVATANVERARALYRVERSAQLPTVGIAGTGTRSRVNEPQKQISSQYQASVGVTAFELDFFGRVRSLSDAALESYFATAAARETARLALVAEVANAYLTLLADREQLALTQRTFDAQKESYDLVKLAFDRGARSMLELRQAETTLETARADHAAFRRQVAQDENALTLLVGSPVSVAADKVLGDDGALLVPGLPEGLPSDLLTRRPDIAQAEHSLRAANANIGAARAAFFPRISLTSALGTASTSLSGLFEGGTKVWSVGADASLPIFDFGRNEANLDVARADRDIAVANYQGAVRTGFREVADALAARSTLDDQVAAQAALVAATRETYTLSQARYDRGVDNYLQVLDAQRSLYAAESGLIVLRQQRLSNLVTLYKALGGGVSDRAPA
ncbi:efflux transporter outer membrane subunit [Niveispirillum sp. KHB5.9]|uniref:efflux transporter outer membrane subunit n=1 Tax=Niveispirillum sp. KHB5.9 TaxID=3400269 RepID=UPI003A83C994